MQPAAEITIILAAFGSALAAAAAGYIWYRIKKDVQKCEDAMSIVETGIKRRLYNQDGTPIYVTYAEFEKRQKACQDHICAEIRELREGLEKMDARREAARNDSERRYNLLMQFVGRVEEYMNRHV
jgi:hypothetical protein